METITESLQREGREEGVFDVTRNMLQRNVDISFVRDMTGLSVEQIGSLQPAFA